MNKTKPFAIPVEVVNAFEFLAPADRGMAFSALFAHIYGNPFDVSSLSGAARATFEMAKIVIEPALRRRRKAAERAAEKAAQKAMEKDPVPAEEFQLDLGEVPPEHIEKMERVVKRALRKNSCAARKRKIIEKEMNRLFPGVYSGIEYDESGNVVLEKFNTAV